MAMTSGNGRAAPLRTYSRRVNNTTTEKPPGKRKLSEDFESVVQLPPAKKFARSSIQSYFQPLLSSSSPAPARSSTLQSSDDLKPGSSPPSSPPPKAISPSILSRTLQKRTKRRLSTKPKSLSTARMFQLSSSFCSQCVGDHLCLKHYDGKTKHLDDYDESESHPSTGDIGCATTAPISFVPNPNRFASVSESGSSSAGSLPPRPKPAKYALASRSGGLTQRQLNLGGDNRTECEDCKFTYDKTSAEDRKSHYAYHADFLERTVNCNSASVKSVDLELATVRGSRHEIYNSGGAILRCIEVTRTSIPSLRAFAECVLGKVNREIGYLKDTKIGDCHVFIHMVNLQPVAVAAVERIEQAHAYSRLRRTVGAARATAVRVSNTGWYLMKNVNKAGLMCVERIWVHEDFRRGKYAGYHFARMTLDIARTHLIHGHDIPKSDVVFSSPSVQGFELACNYCTGAFDRIFPGLDVELLVKPKEFE